jgi:hypothetical protein
VRRSSWQTAIAVGGCASVALKPPNRSQGAIGEAVNEALTGLTGMRFVRGAGQNAWRGQRAEPALQFDQSLGQRRIVGHRQSNQLGVFAFQAAEQIR